MTAEQTRRVHKALAETNVFIDREEKCDPTLRPEKTAKLLEFYKQHRIRLLGMLDGTVTLPTLFNSRQQ